MKRIIALLLCFMLLLSACGESEIRGELTSDEVITEGAVNDKISEDTLMETSSEKLVDDTVSFSDDINMDFSGLDDANLKYYVEDLVYSETIENLNSTEFVVEEVRCCYLSNEYVDELTYNSQENIYFGYTLSELDEYFQGSRYVFTLGETGNTVVQEIQEIADNNTNEIIKNVAIGSGVILLCVTVSVVSPMVGAPAAFTAIFAASAKSASIFALSSGVFGALTSAIVEGYQTKDFDKALDAAILSGSEGFKWGAISGAVIGGGKEVYLLKAGAKSGLTMSEVATIQQESKLPLEVVSQLHSFDEYLVYKEAGLKPVMVNGQIALLQDIDLNYISELPNGSQVTNLVRMRQGYAPLDPATGKAYQLHHVGQKNNGTLAVLTESQHQGNAAVLNIFGKDSEIARSQFDSIRKKFWQYVGHEIYANGGI